jgi:hypothetical protein
MAVVARFDLQETQTLLPRAFMWAVKEISRTSNRESISINGCYARWQDTNFFTKGSVGKNRWPETGHRYHWFQRSLTGKPHLPELRGHSHRTGLNNSVYSWNRLTTPRPTHNCGSSSPLVFLCHIWYTYAIVFFAATETVFYNGYNH